MAVSASLLAISVAAASLNLCSDEYLLLLASPGEIRSVSRLSQDPAESALAGLARRVPGNRGRIEDVVSLRPDLVLTMGGGGRSSSRIARALGMRVLDLPQPGSIGDVARSLRLVATALGEPRRALPWLARLSALEATRPTVQRDTIYLSHGGWSQSPGSLGAQWMGLSGLRQRSLPGGRVTLETVATNPSKVLLRSNYRAGQMSQGQRWLDHPILSRLPSDNVSTDGRAWTCSGPLMIPEIERLRKVLH